MSKIVSEEGYVIDSLKYWDNKSCIGKRYNDYKIKDVIAFRETLCSIWFSTECLKTKGMLEDAIDVINDRIKKDLFLQ